MVRRPRRPRRLGPLDDGFLFAAVAVGAAAGRRRLERGLRHRLPGHLRRRAGASDPDVQGGHAALQVGHLDAELVEL